MRITGWRIVGVVSIGVAAMCLITFAWMDAAEPALRLLVRNTARIAAVFFSFAFAASGLHTLLRTRSTAWLLQNRRYIGVAFAVTHIGHLALVAALLAQFPEPPGQRPLAVVAGGALAYVFLVLMALTSFDRTAALIGPRAWKALHKTGSYYLWGLFALAYVPRAVRDTWYLLPAALVIASAAVRVVAWYVSRQRRNSHTLVSE